MKNITNNDVVYTCSIDTPLGAATASAAGEALNGFWFTEQKYYPDDTEAWVNDLDYPVFKRLRAWLRDYFSGINRQPDLVLQPRGTLFQKTVWNTLINIPYGRLATYSEIARKIAKSRHSSSISARAVGGAVGHNPISILIPCHRVVGANVSLTGYAGGLDKKEFLLRLENVTLEQANLVKIP
jgi:methylated-DNA-[protein]-cysteine S-methyltransferase